MEGNSIIVPIFASIFMLIGVVFFTGFVLLMTLLNGNIHYTTLILTVAVSLYVAYVLHMFRFFKTKKRVRIFWSIAGIALAGSLVQPIYYTYVDRIPTVDAEVNVYEYEPFTDSHKVATLDHEASLQLIDNLPKIDGATAMYPLYSAFVQATYPEKSYHPYQSEVMVNTTPDAYNNLISGRVDVIFTAGPSEAQRERAKKLGLEFKLTPIGREAFVFFVNQKNDIDGLTLQQIKDIYSGKVTNWSEVGGGDDSIRAFQRPEDSGSQTALQSLMGDTPIMEAPTEDVATGMGGIINEVSQYKNYKNAIGYTFRFYSTEMVGDNRIKLLEISGVSPTKETIRSGTYPIASDFYAVTTNTGNPNVEKFIDWVLSDEGQRLVEQAGYVPVME
ncbi:PstS family phosphate ABC transporter substrate-binding protein [Solibacillus sp. FSL H8-0538]|uniref:PstS family phosphate ABC transporter substrate-binding protein n=1 Tax=Solibacillus sp. FSL H8-0538 TaxID=2921400 RepID=UPI0030FAE9A9